MLIVVNPMMFFLHLGIFLILSSHDCLAYMRLLTIRDDLATLGIPACNAPKIGEESGFCAKKCFVTSCLTLPLICP